MTPGGQAVAADDGVLVGEQRDLGVAGADQPGGEAGEPVERGGPVHLDDQPAGGRDAVRVAQRVGVAGTGGRLDVDTRAPFLAPTARPAGRTSGSC